MFSKRSELNLARLNPQRRHCTTLKIRERAAYCYLGEFVGLCRVLGRYGMFVDTQDGERDRCRRQATLRALVATADLNEAKDDAMREDARRRLEAADRQLSALPAFEHAPDYQLDLAISFYRQMEDASPTEQRSLRLRGEQAFRAAKRLYEACFCNDLASRFRELGENFAPTTTESSRIP